MYGYHEEKIDVDHYWEIKGLMSFNTFCFCFLFQGPHSMYCSVFIIWCDTD